MAIECFEASLRLCLDSNPAKPSVTVSGAANGSNISRLVEALDSLAETVDRCIALEMEDLESMDSLALEQFARSAGSLAGRGQRLRLASVSPAVAEAFDGSLISEILCTRSECAANSVCARCDIAEQPCVVDVFSLPSSFSQCREARARIAQTAEALGLSPADTEDVTLAVGEAVANAIEHGGSDGDDCFTVTCVATPGQLAVSVSDHGPGFNPDDVPSLGESLVLEHGRGIICMKMLMDEVSFHFHGGTTARMIKRLG